MSCKSNDDLAFAAIVLRVEPEVSDQSSDKTRQGFISAIRYASDILSLLPHGREVDGPRLKKRSDPSKLGTTVLSTEV
jgi:hypothetical protein